MFEDAPIVNLEIDDEVVFSPIDYFDYKKNKEGKIIPHVPEKCIICFEPCFLAFAETNFGLIEMDWFRSEFKLFKLKNYDIILVHVNYGAALSSIALEELIALGVKDFVTLGSAGTLQDNIPLSSIIIVDSAIREEGVSYHYLKPSKFVECSRELLDKAKQISKNDPGIFFGNSWTTDSFYRETIPKVKRYKSEGVCCVEMEAAALYSVAKFRGANAISVLFVSDSIANLKWNPEFRKTNSESNQLRMFDIAIKILS